MNEVIPPQETQAEGRGIGGLQEVAKSLEFGQTSAVLTHRAWLQQASRSGEGDAARKITGCDRARHDRTRSTADRFEG